MTTLHFTRVLLIAAIPFLAALPHSSYAADTPASQVQQAHLKVVFQVSDNDSGKWNLTLNNAFNAQREFGADKIDIEIVAYGPGINMLKFDSSVSGRIMEALQKGIRIEACQNTMRGMKLTPKDMLPNIGYVPSGVGEIIMKEQEGYAYIRP
jgi:intracellular sulfur oxidation DsrE/DsrF family protein